MIEELKSMELVKKLGGRFKLTALIQKRLQELMQGARPLIEDTENKTQLEIVIQEIKEDKITLEEPAAGHAVRLGQGDRRDAPDQQALTGHGVLLLAGIGRLSSATNSVGPRRLPAGSREGLGCLVVYAPYARIP